MKTTITEFFISLERKKPAAAQPGLAAKFFTPRRARMTTRLWMLACAAAVSLAVDATAGQLIQTLVGTGDPVCEPENPSLPATATRISGLFNGMAYDQGLLYFVEYGGAEGGRIRRRNADVTVTTVVGKCGPGGFTPDGDPAIGAMLDRPFQIAFDQQHNLYFVESYNQRVRKVAYPFTPASVIVTVAGGGTDGPPDNTDGKLAIKATLAFPGGMAFDSFGNLYLSDRNHATICKVDMTTGFIKTVVGPGIPIEETSCCTGGRGLGFDISRGTIGEVETLLFDANNNLYCGCWTSRILKIAPADNGPDGPATGAITVFAGNGNCGNATSPVLATDPTAATISFYNSGLAIHPMTGNLYFSNYLNNVVRKVEASGMMTVVAGICGAGTCPPGGYNGDGIDPLTARLNGPCALLFDPAGGLLIADNANFRIRYIPPDSTPCSGVANDHPINALLDSRFQLQSGATVYGSLACADATPLGLSWYPGNAPKAKDVWYSYTPTDFGEVHLTTCVQQPCGFPASDTQLAVYTGSPGTELNGKASGVALQAVGTSSATYLQDMGTTACTQNPKAADLTFKATKCTTYFVRVSGKFASSTASLFGLQFNFTATPTSYRDCVLTPLTVSANSSTPFHVAAGGSAWFRFTAPPVGGPWPTEVDTCPAVGLSVTAVFEGSCTGPQVTPSDLMNCSTLTPFTFQAVANTTYFVQVNNPGPSSGCGFLHFASGVPIPGVPASFLGLNGNNCRPYWIRGTPNSAAWKWLLTAPPSADCPQGFNLTGDGGPVPPNPLGARAIAQRFSDQINTAFNNAGGVGKIASVKAVGLPPTETYGLRICTKCPLDGLVLKVRSDDSQPWCWVQFDTLGDAFPPCVVNPEIFEVGDPYGLNTDCNTNGVADYLDLMDATSRDVNGNGIPDECEGCIPVEIADGPYSTGNGLGGDATLAVEAVGTGPFAYQWRKDGVPLTGQTSATIMLTSLATNDAGLYDVVVTNACGDATSASAVVTVDPTPVLKIAAAGNNVVLSWTATGYHLQANSAVNNPAGWSSVAGASPVSVPITSAPQFFRLQRD